MKRVLISENINVAMKDNRYINKLSKIKKLVQGHYPSLYKKHIFKSIFQLNLGVKSIVNWSLIMFELDESGALEGDPNALQLMINIVNKIFCSANGFI